MAWGARSFNGTSDHVNFGNITTSLTNTTVSLWANVTVAAAGGFGYLFSRNNSTNANFFEFGTHSGNWQFFVATVGGTSQANGTAVTAGIWYHLALSYDSTNGSVFYVNGVSTLTGAAGGNMKTGSTTAWIGGDPSGGGSGFANAIIADVAVWNATLTLLEIKGLSQGMRPGAIRAPVLWSPVDGLQSPEADLSGNAFNGTVTGTSVVFGPPIAPFTPRWPQFLAPAVAPTFNPAWAKDRNTVIEGVAT
jgi:hypothetical protein